MAGELLLSSSKTGFSVHVTNSRVVAGSCKHAGEAVAYSCQQFRAAVGSFPELTSTDNETIYVPINPVRIKGW